MAILSQPPECWAYRFGLPHLQVFWLFQVSSLTHIDRSATCGLHHAFTPGAMLPNRQAEVSHLRADTQAQSPSAFHPLELHLIFTSWGWAFPWITNKDGLSLSPHPLLVQKNSVERIQDVDCSCLLLILLGKLFISSFIANYSLAFECVFYFLILELWSCKGHCLSKNSYP